MLDCERFSRDRAKTAGTGKAREGHQQMADQREQQFHSERNFNGLRAISKSALRRLVLPKSAIRHRQVSAAPRLKQLRAPVQVIWGDAEVLFDMGPSLSWLRQNIPAIRKVITVPRAKLFFPEEHPKLISVLLGEFWHSAV
jgi:pimeloyl-ACP methyl ester carboxylesterase